MPPPIQPDSQLWGSAPFFKDLFTRPLTSLVAFFFALSTIQDPGSLTVVHSGVPDPCAAIAGRVWVNASEVRACFASFQVDLEEKANVGAIYNSPYLLFFLLRLTSSPITRFYPLVLGSSTSTHPPITRSGPPSRLALTFSGISSTTSSGSKRPISRMISSSTLMFHALSRSCATATPGISTAVTIV